MAAATSVRFLQQPSGDHSSELSQRAPRTAYDEEGNTSSAATTSRLSMLPNFLRPRSDPPLLSRSLTIIDEEQKVLLQGKVKKLGTFSGVCALIWGGNKSWILFNGVE